MKVRGVKKTGFSRVVGGLRAPEVEMISGCEMYTRRSDGLEFSVKLETVTGSGRPSGGAKGSGWIRLTLNEAEIRDWHMRLGRALASLDETKTTL